MEKGLGRAGSTETKRENGLGRIRNAAIHIVNVGCTVLYIRSGTNSSSESQKRKI